MLATEQKIQTGFTLALLLACGIGVMSYYSVVRQRDEIALVAHTHEVIASLESLFGSVTDSVSSERGYVITGQNSYLETYDRAARDIAEDIHALRRLTADNSAERRRLDSLATLVGERGKFSSGINELRRKGHAAAAQSAIATGTGNEIHDRIRGLIDEMQGVERNLLKERQLRARRASEIAQAVILLGGLLTLGVVATALFFIMRDFSGRRQADAMLRETLDQLEDRVRDRTANLEHANQSLVAGEARLQGVLQSAMDAIIAVDDRQNIVMFNAAAEKIFHCAAKDAVGGPLDRFIPERFRVEHHAHIERFGDTGTTTRAMGARLDLFGLRADGEEFPIDASISQVVADGRKFYTVILRDITERKRAEDVLANSYQELRDLSVATHQVREAERLRVARELHDELAQWLTAIKMDISWIASRMPAGQVKLVERAEKTKGLVDTTVAAVRRIAADLRPVMLDDLGLVAALEHLLHDLSQRAGIVVSLDAEEAGLDFGEPLASSLYRIAQEAMTNVVRHAAASEARLEIHIRNDELVLTVTDNGRGIDLGAAARTKSYGIMGIRERARTLGGSAQIARVETGGTRVEIRIPMARYRRGGGG